MSKTSAILKKIVKKVVIYAFKIRQFGNLACVKHLTNSTSVRESLNFYRNFSIDYYTFI